MKNQNAFYYIQEQSSEQYSRNPKGSLNVNRLINGNQECWISPVLPRVLKKKSLVLADWTSEKWSLEKIEKVQQSLSQLIGEGFCIYVWQDGRVIPIKMNDLSMLNKTPIRSLITLAHTQDIVQAAVAQNKLTYNEVHVLDDYWINYMLSDEKEPGERVLSTSTISELSSHQLNSLSKILSCKTPKLSKIIYDEFSEKTCAGAQLFQSINRGVELESDYKKVSFSKQTIDSLMSEHKICLSGIDLTTAELAKIEEIEFKDGISWEQLVYMLSVAPRLKNICLSRGAEKPEELFKPPQGSLDNLTCINLSNANISRENLEVILKSAPNLQKIHLSACKNLNGEFNLDENSLVCLKEIDISGQTNLTSKNMQSLLKAAPNLKKMCLTRLNELGTTISPDQNSLTGLEEIVLNNSRISVGNIEILLKATPNLKRISLIGVLSLQMLNLPPKSLESLVEIDLSRAHISGECLDIILKAAPNLKKISLSHTIIQKAFQSTTGWNLSQFEDINLENCQISFGNLDLILKSAPNLRKISLRDAQYLNQSLTPHPSQFFNLEEIDLSNTNISMENLQTILKAAPKLRKIDMNSCKNLDLSIALNIPPGSLTNLEELDLSGSNISMENLQIILEAAPKLRKICLKGILNSSQSIHLNAASLDEIVLDSSNISCENLELILSATPQLQKICLHGILNPSQTLNLEETSLARLKKIELISSNISCANLEIILRAAPGLKKISFNKCQYLNQTPYLHSPELGNLEEIDIYESSISKENLEIILKAAPNLSESSKTCIQSLISPAKSQISRLPDDLNGSPYSNVPHTGGAVSSASNPSHDIRNMRDFKPSGRPFQFKGDNKTLNQGMLIEKLCQYLTLKQQHLDVIPKIQGGICSALSHYFLSIEKDKWDKFVNMALSWDGKLDTLDPQYLTPSFDALYFYINQYQLQQQTPKHYIGDALNVFLDTNQLPCILTNPWHAIAIKPHIPQQNHE
jgi:uncharacterized protein YjbI with pentapeptide repeats